jgi:hypothetical protein
MYGLRVPGVPIRNRAMVGAKQSGLTSQFHYGQGKEGVSSGSEPLVVLTSALIRGNILGWWDLGDL